MSDLSKIKKQVKSEAKKSKLVVKDVPDKRKKPVLAPRPVIDSEIRDFFNNFINLESPEEIEKEWKQFYKNINYSLIKQLFIQIYDALPLNKLQEFAMFYSVQDEYNIQDYWKIYSSDENIKKKIKKKEKTKVVKPIFKQPDPKIGLRLKPLNYPKRQKPENIGIDIISKNCMFNYKFLGWLGLKVDTLYLHEIKDDLSNYVNKDDEYVDSKGQNWYASNKKIYDILCSLNFKHEQKEDIFTAVNIKNNSRISFKIAFMTKQGFIIQNEEFVKQKNSYEKNKATKVKNYMDDVLNQPISNKTRKIVMFRLSSFLKDIAPNNQNYGKENSESELNPNTEYIQNVVNGLSENAKNNKELFENLGNIIVYVLESSYIDQSIFKKRIQQEYYTSSILPVLSAKDKLPGIFDDPSISQERKDYVTRVISMKINTFIDELVMYMYRLDNPDEQRIFIGSKPIVPIMERSKPWKSICKNRKSELVKNSPPEQIIYYEVDGVTYCLNIIDIIETVSAFGSYEIPRTNIEVDDDFVEHVLKTYKVPEEKQGEEPEIDEEEESPIVGLLELIKLNLNKCENEIDNDNLDENGKCKGLGNIKDDSDDESIKTDDSDDESIKTDDSDDESIKTDDSDDESIKTDDSDDESIKTDDSDDESIKTPDDSDENSPFNYVDDNEEYSCYLCEKNIKNPSLKTKHKINGEYNTVCYCSFDCFEMDEKILGK